MNHLFEFNIVISDESAFHLHIWPPKALHPLEERKKLRRIVLYMREQTERFYSTAFYCLPFH